MGFFGSMGKAMMAPIRATNSVAGKMPGAQGIMGAANKLPGMQTANKLNPMMQGFMKQKPGGIGPTQPPVGLGGSIPGGPTPPSMGSPTPMPNIPFGGTNTGINGGSPGQMGGGMMRAQDWRGINDPRDQQMRNYMPAPMQQKQSPIGPSYVPEPTGEPPVGMSDPNRQRFSPMEGGPMGQWATDYMKRTGQQIYS